MNNGTTNNPLYEYLLLLGDSPMVLGHRLSELCGHGPSLETDIALTNLSLDLFGQTRLYFQYAAKLAAEKTDEDKIAFLRYPHQYRNTLLVEQPNNDFAYVIARQFLFDAFHLPMLEQLMGSKDHHLAAIAAKSIKEVRYHLVFSSDWVKRLGDGTELSHGKMQAAIDYLYRYAAARLVPSALETSMAEQGIGYDLHQVGADFEAAVSATLTEATLSRPDGNWPGDSGREGIHSEHMGFILADLQFMQRTYPNMKW